MWSVSYYVERESLWQFAGEFATRADAETRAAYLRDKGSAETRIRKLRGR